MNDVTEPMSLSGRTRAAIREVLDGGRGGWRAILPFTGPAVVASIAYMDPGNFATNIQAGAHFGYTLLWVVLMANLIAMLFQALSAKLGIATGCNLAALCRRHLPRRLVFAMWAVSEVAAMATDLAEFVGGAIGFSLLFHLPPMGGMAVTAVATCALLAFDRGGFRPMELAIGVLVAALGVCYLIEMFIAPIAWGTAAYHAVVPSLPNGEALTIAVGIVGATVMPHAIYLHSGLTRERAPAHNAAECKTLVRFSNREVLVAFPVAGLVNMAMVAMAAATFHAGHRDVADIGTAWHMLTPLLGAGAAAVFLISLICSGVSSSVVGTLAGQMIMQDFTGLRIPLWTRRLATMIPAFVVVALGVEPTGALVLSQVVLSFALPVPMIALVAFTRRRDVMGALANGRVTNVVAIAGTVVVLLLNVVLLVQACGGSVPGLPGG